MLPKVQTTCCMLSHCCCSVTKLYPTLCDLIDPRIPASSTLSQSLLKLMSNHLILSCPLLLSSMFTSIRVFSNESALCIRWPKYWNFSFSISLSNEYSGLIPFTIGWISLQSKRLWRAFSNTIVQKHQSFSIQPCLWSNSHIHTWLVKKTIALTIWAFISTVMSLLFNMLSRLVITFLS